MIQNNTKKTFKMLLLKQIYVITNFNNIILYLAIFIVLLNIIMFQYLQLIELADYYKIVHNDYLNLLKQIENISFTFIEKDIEINELRQQLNIDLKKELNDLAIEQQKKELKIFYSKSKFDVLILFLSFAMLFFLGPYEGPDF